MLCFQARRWNPILQPSNCTTDTASILWCSCVASLRTKVAKTFEGFLFLFLLVCNRFKKCTSKECPTIYRNLMLPFPLFLYTFAHTFFYLLNMEHFLTSSSKLYSVFHQSFQCYHKNRFPLAPIKVIICCKLSGAICNIILGFVFIMSPRGRFTLEDETTG